jgi:hypothetical protein
MNGPDLRLPLIPRIERARSVKLVGLGGVGGIVARYLVAYLAAAPSPARLTLIDGDEFEPHNAERMLFSREGNKAEVARDDLLEFTESSRLTVVAVPEFVTVENLPRLILEEDLVLLAVDNHATRKLVDDHCGRLADVCLISGGNDGVEDDPGGRRLRGTSGNVQIHLRCGGCDESPALGSFHPEIAVPRDALPTDVSCTEALVSVPQLLFTNLATASAILNAMFLQLCDALHYPELCFDIAAGAMRPLELPGPV